MISRLSRHLLGVVLWIGGVLLIALVPPVAGQQAKKQPEKHLVLEARPAPADPFSDMNRADRQAGAKFEVARGSTFLVVISGKTIDGWYTYPLTQRGPKQLESTLSTLKIEGEHFQPLYPVQETQAEWMAPEGIDPYLTHQKPFTWTQEVYVKPEAPEGKTLELTLHVRAQVCKKSCIWEDHVLKVPVTIATGPPVPPSDALKARLKEKPPAPTVVPEPAGLVKNGSSGPTRSGSSSGDSSGSDVTKPAPKGLLGSILVAIAGGFVSLLTPCVFPMIPITVSYFLKQAEKPASPGTAADAPYNPLLMAMIYSGTIVLVLTAGGLALLQVLVQISTHPLTNFIIGGLFLFFALSLLGWYDITLPSWLQDLTASGEGKGGLVGVVFMALTFSIISFACVGPIYGSFISLQAGSAGALGLLERVLPVVAYSAAFASPFFLLALFPALMRTMPKAGSWMNSVKVVMGFLELAAVVKFLRAGELLWKGRTDYLTYDVSMALYVAISIACGLYLLGLYRLPHDHEAPESIGVPRLMFSLSFIALGLYLLPGVFKTDNGESQRPSGIVFAWVDSFLLPDPENPNKPAGKGSAGTSLVWGHNLNEALAQAARENKLVFLDFTGINCTNCKLNERNIFPRPEVQQAFAKHVLLKLYTDTPPAGSNQQPDAAGALKLREERFKSEALPLYALLRPTGGDSFEIVDRFGDDGNGLIEVSDIPRFIKWLER